MTKCIKTECEIDYNVDHIVDKFLNGGSIDAQIKSILTTTNKTKHQKFVQMLTDNHITFYDSEKSNDNKETKENKKLKDNGECAWVPAVFCSSETSSSRIYGGVSLHFGFSSMKLDNEIRKAVNTSGGFSAMQTGKYSFVKRDVFSGDSTTYEVRTTGSGWREHVSYVYTRTEKAFRPIINSVTNTLHRLNIISLTPIITKPVTTTKPVTSTPSITTSTVSDMSVKVIRRNIEHLPFRVGHLAHSAILVQQGNKYHVLELMGDGIVHLNRDVQIGINAFPSWSDYSINGREWRGQTRGINLTEKLNLSPEKLQEMMQDLFNECGEYEWNKFKSNYNSCHTVQEKFINKLKDMSE